MEDGEGGFSFDFEGAIDSNAITSGANISAGGGGNMLSSGIVSTVAAAGLGTSASSNGPGPNPGLGPLQSSGRRNYRQTVCRHWLRGLCMKGDVCGFLHQLDRSRMPVCRFFTRHGECHEPDCVYKHTYEDIKECNMYKMGFCPNGGECRYRHIKLPGPFPPLEESLQKIQVRTAASGTRQYGGRHIAQRQGLTGQDGTLALPSSQPLAIGEDVQNLPPLPPIPPQELQHQHQEVQLPPPPPMPLPASTQRVEQLETAQNQAWQPIVTNVPPNQAQIVSASSPLPQGFSRFFIVKSSNRENLELSVARGLWATHRNNESKLNEAFDSCDNVILIFSVNETGHFQGCARMMSKIGVIVGGGGWKYAHGTAHYGRNFRLKWLKLCELSFNKTRHLRNPYKENLPVKISRDCQELEPNVGEQLASLLYMEPDSELMKLANDAERKWEEEKTQGTAQDMEDTPFDVVEEDQEDEEESEEEESSTPTANIASKRVSTAAEIAWKKNRGRGRNLVPGGDPLFGVGYDRFPSPANGFNKALGRGVFPTYPSLPRYGGHINMAFGPMDAGGVLAPGMLLSGRPPPNGLFVHTGTGTGMGMMGPPGSALMVGVRPGNIMAAPRPLPFIAGPGRPGSGIPFRPPPPPGQAWLRRDQPPARLQKNESNSSGGDRLHSMGDPSGVEKSLGGEVFGMSEADTRYSPKVGQLQEGDFGGESYGKEDDDSLSEDEAPRRSRHGKRRRE